MLYRGKNIRNLLVKEDDIRFPDLVRRQPEDTDASVVSLVPLQLVVVPHLPKLYLKGQSQDKRNRPVFSVFLQLVVTPRAELNMLKGTNSHLTVTLQSSGTVP